MMSTYKCNYKDICLLILCSLSLTRLKLFSFLFVIMFFLLILFCLIIYIYIINKKSSQQMKSYFNYLRQIPGPKSIYFFGNRWMYYSYFGNYKLNKLHEAYKHLFQTYGQIFREEYIWNFPVVNICNRNDLHVVLKASSKSKYPLRPPNEVTSYYRKSRPDRYTNLGLVNEQGEMWHLLRTNLTPELTSGKTMQIFLPELNLVSGDFNRLIKYFSKNNIVPCFNELANRMGLESACTLILGKRLGFLNEDLGPITLRLSNAVHEQFLASRDTFYGLPLWKLFPTPAYKKFIQSEDIIYDIISNLVDEALEDETNTCSIDNDVQTVFMSILKAPQLDIRDKKAAIIDFIAAGIKTFGNTLVFILYLIAKNPFCQNKIYEEILEFAPSIHQDFTLNIIQSSKYLRACIFEAFRLLPTAPLMARISEEPMDLSGYHIPVGSVLLCHTWEACLNDDNFANAKLFQPERWLGENVCQENSFLVCPFGVGRRMCPGKRFTELELQVCIANIIREFNVKFDGELELEFEFLLAPRSPSSFKFEPR